MPPVAQRMVAGRRRDSRGPDSLKFAHHLQPCQVELDAAADMDLEEEELEEEDAEDEASGALRAIWPSRPQWPRPGLAG